MLSFGLNLVAGAVRVWVEICLKFEQRTMRANSV